LTAGGSRGLLVSFNSGTPGTFTVQIIGTGGFSNLITNQTAGLFFNITDSFGGVRATVSGAVSLSHGSGTLPESTFLSAVNATTGAAIYSKSASVIMNFNAGGMGHFIDEIPTSPYWLATDCGIDVSAASASCLLSRTPDVLHIGSMNINDYSFVNLQFGQTLGSPGYSPLADLLAGGRVDIIDISIESLYFGCSVITP
jgi:hypothetical protein